MLWTIPQPLASLLWCSLKIVLILLNLLFVMFFVFFIKKKREPNLFFMFSLFSMLLRTTNNFQKKEANMAIEFKRVKFINTINILNHREF